MMPEGKRNKMSVSTHESKNVLQKSVGTSSYRHDWELSAKVEVLYAVSVFDPDMFVALATLTDKS